MALTMELEQIKENITREMRKPSPDWDRIKRLCNSAKVADNVLSIRKDAWIGKKSDNPPIKIL